MLEKPCHPNANCYDNFNQDGSLVIMFVDVILLQVGLKLAVKVRVQMDVKISRLNIITIQNQDN